jgi:hypothetical protein
MIERFVDYCLIKARTRTTTTSGGPGVGIPVDRKKLVLLA